MDTTDRALIVDNDAALRQSLADQFECLEGFDAVGAKTGEQALDVVKDHQFSVILIDVDLPDIDGRDLCRLMRRQGLKAPIIMLSVYDTDADMILSLDSGANDYIAKPFRLGVLLARVRAQLRQFRLSDDAIFPIGPYSFHPSAKMLIEMETERKIYLTERETSLLKYLYRTGNRPVPRQALLNQVWGYNTDVKSHTIETHIYRLRQKIEPNPTRAQFLLTESEGYRLAR